METVRECEILPAAEMLLGFDEDTLRGEKNKFPSLVIVVSCFFRRNMYCHISFVGNADAIALQGGLCIIFKLTFVALTLQ